MNITLPHNFNPRIYQNRLLQALDPVYEWDSKGNIVLGKDKQPVVVREAVKRALAVWHRRSGKDLTFLNFMIKRMFERVGAYYYFLPEFNQGRKILWDGMNRDGFPYMDYFPKEIIKKKNNQEMKVLTVNGSLFQIIGTDNFDAVMGTNPVGCVFSEYSLQNPQAWDFIRPILTENEGWAIFNFTPRGMNHAFKLFNQVQHNPKWFCELLTVNDTKRDDGTPVITPEMVQEERESGMSEGMVQQEYYCDFTASAENRIISLELIAEANKRSYHQSIYSTAPKILGVDVAEGEVEGDKHAMIKRQGLQAFDLVVRNDCDTMVWANQVSHEIIKWKPDAVFVDGIGVGAGVVARLKQLGHKKIISIKAGSSSSKPVEYRDIKTEMWDGCREWMDDGGAIPDNKDLTIALSSGIRDFDSSSRMFMLSKKKVKEDYGYDSPDEADALVLTFAQKVNPSMGSIGVGRNKDRQRAQDYDPLGRRKAA